MKKKMNPFLKLYNIVEIIAAGIYVPYLAYCFSTFLKYDVNFRIFIILVSIAVIIVLGIAAVFNYKFFIPLNKVYKKIKNKEDMTNKERVFFFKRLFFTPFFVSIGTFSRVFLGSVITMFIYFSLSTVYLIDIIRTLIFMFLSLISNAFLNFAVSENIVGSILSDPDIKEKFIDTKRYKIPYMGRSILSMLSVVIIPIVFFIIYNYNLIVYGKMYEFSQFIKDVIIVGSLTFIIAIIVSFIDAKNVYDKLQIVTTTVTNIREGLLHTKISELPIKDNFLLMLKKMENMRVFLKKHIKTIGDISIEMVYISQDIKDHTIKISEGAKNEAASLEEASASFEELSASISKISEQTEKASDFSKSTLLKFKNAADRVKEMVNVIDQIKINSDNITQMISIINGIAERTNLLALNASIEAARAGEAGKGFAVVAGEIRSLAENSHNASDKITELIKENIKAVKMGIEASDIVNTEINEALKNIGDIFGLNTEITASTAEQNNNAAELLKVIELVNDISEQNVKISEIFHGISKELYENSEKLRNFSKKFVL